MPSTASFGPVMVFLATPMSDSVIVQSTTLWQQMRTQNALTEARLFSRKDAFWVKLIPFMFNLAANLLLELVVNCGKEEFHANFYSYIYSGTIRMHFNSHSKLDLCFSIQGRRKLFLVGGGG